MSTDDRTVWLAAGVRTPFVHVDGPLARRDSLALSVPAVQAMAQRASGPIDFAVSDWLRRLVQARDLWQGVQVSLCARATSGSTCPR